MLDQVQPRPEYGLKTRNDSSSGASIWDLMQPDSKSKRSVTSANEHTSSSANDRNRARRDPIGYFSDTKYGDQQQPIDRRAYQPSWTTNGGGVTGGGEPIAVNGYEQ